MKSLSLVVVAIGLLTACASVVPPNEQPDSDPFEYTNRKVYKLNKTLDDYAFKPVAKGYRAVTPQFFRSGINNVFNNLREIPNVVNDLLQAQALEAAKDTTRFALNSTIGVAGFFDVASDFGLEFKRNTLGQTLQTWGMKYSPFIIIPGIGPSTVRDFFGRVVDSRANPFFMLAPASWDLPYYALYGVATREAYLDSDDIRSVLSFDEYLFLRDAYLQQVSSRVAGGEQSLHQSDEFIDDDF